MKPVSAVIVMLLITLNALAIEDSLFPDEINRILGRIQPGMKETQVEEIVKNYYPDAILSLGTWSGQTGYVNFELTSRYSISVAECNDPEDTHPRFVLADMILYVYDWELNQRISISFQSWD